MEATNNAKVPPQQWGGNETTDRLAKALVRDARAFALGTSGIRSGLRSRALTRISRLESIQSEIEVRSGLVEWIRQATLRRGFCLVACAILAACGGGGGGRPDPAQQVQATPKPVTIDAEGDSTMYGRDAVTQGQVQTPAPAEMQNQLTAMLGSGITVENNGVPGSTTRNDLDGTAPDTTALAKRLASDPSQIVIANFGINDAYYKRTTDQYGADLTEWIATVRSAGKTAVLQEPNPVCWDQVNLDPYVEMMRVIAQQQNVTLIQQYDYIKSLPNWQAMEPDCIHPNQALYIIIGDRAAEQLQPLARTFR